MRLRKNACAALQRLCNDSQFACTNPWPTSMDIAEAIQSGFSSGNKALGGGFSTFTNIIT